MEKTITYLPVEWMEHHPKNPRREIGDIKELTASVRESGILQNLTVVPRDDGQEGYWVVIGNRRMEAAKRVGLKLVPAYVSDMDEKTQLATMMAENMQRVDLTAYEQAEGVQMMMDLGMTEEEVSKKTGLRKDTIARRRLLVKHDKKAVEAALARGGTIQDFVALEKVEDGKEKEKLIGLMGKESFRGELNWTLERQKKKKLFALLGAKIDQWATKVERQGYVGEKNVPMSTVRTWWRITDSEVEEMKPPRDIRDVHYYWTLESNGESLRLMREVTEKRQEDREELLRRQRDEWMKEHREKAAQVHSVLKQMRDEWISFPGNIRIGTDDLLAKWTRAAGLGCLSSNLGSQYEGLLKQVTGMTLVGNDWEKRVDPDLLEESVEVMPKVASAALLYCMLGKGDLDMWNLKWGEKSVAIVRSESKQLIMIYDLLTSMGYQMSDEEKAYMDGSHEIYCEWRAEE